MMPLTHDALLVPTPGDKPAGVCVRYDTVYDQIREARREDDPRLPQGVWQADLKKADWRAVEALCRETLERRSKDLQVAAWLLEAWIHLYGGRGACEGLGLIAGLCETFWEELYPEIIDGDVEYRLAPLFWIEEKLPDALRRIALTEADPRHGPAYTYADWEDAEWLEKHALKDKQVLHDAERTHKVTRAKILAGVTLSSSKLYQTLVGEVSSTLEQLDRLVQVLEAKVGQEAPGFVRLRAVLQAMLNLAHGFLSERSQEQTQRLPSKDRVSEAVLQVIDPTGIIGHRAGGISSREEAYRRLSEAAEYLLRTEPHSPTPYLVKRAVTWGSMSLGELLGELVQNEHDLQAVYALLGLNAR